MKCKTCGKVCEPDERKDNPPNSANVLNERTTRPSDPTNEQTDSALTLLHNGFGRSRSICRMLANVLYTMHRHTHTIHSCAHVKMRWHDDDVAL